MSAARVALLPVFRERAVAFGRFTLASGKESSYYINSKQAIFNSEVLKLLADALYESAQDLDVEAAGGPEVGAIPMAAALAYRYALAGRNLEGFFVRKQAKGHGSRERLEGQVHAGDRVVVVDDVLTTGGSVLQAIEAVEAAGATVARVVCICDRLQRAGEALAKYDFRPLFTVRDFGIEPTV